MGLGVEHHHVGAQAGLVALDRKRIGLLGAGQRCHLFGLLAQQRLFGADGVTGFAHGIEQHPVVLGDRHVQVGLAPAQLGAQASAVEDRQAQRRRHAVLAAAEVEQVAESECAQPDEGGQVDVGIELDARHRHVLRGGLDAPAGGYHVGAASEQVCAERHRRRVQPQRVQARRQGVEGRRRLPGQHRDLAAPQHDLLVQRLDLGARIGQGAFGLRQFDLAVQTRRSALARQAEELAALRQRALRDFALGQQAGQGDVASADLGGEAGRGGRHLGLRGARLIARGSNFGGMAAEQVRRPAEIALHAGVVTHLACDRRRDQAVLGVPLARHVRAQRELRSRSGAADFGQRRGTVQAGTYDRQIRVALERLIDQRVEPGVAQCGPPARRRQRRKRRVEPERSRHGAGQRRMLGSEVGAARHYDHTGGERHRPDTADKAVRQATRGKRKTG